MATKNNDQLQIRIDAQTKKEAKKILDGLGLDMSAAIKLFFRQVINANNLPFEVRDRHGLTLKGAQELREAIADAASNPKSFPDAASLIKGALAD